jgi:hypothetical protein
VPGTPFGVAVDREGRVRVAGVVNNLDHMEEMVAAALEPLSARDLARPISGEATVLLKEV